GVVFENPDVSKRLMRAQLDSDFFIDLLGLYWVLLEDSFNIGFIPSAQIDTSRVEDEVSRCNLFELLTAPQQVLGLLHHVGATATVCARDDTLHMLLSGKLRRDRDSERLEDAIGRARRRLHGTEAWPAPDPMIIDAYVTAVSSVLPFNTGFPKR